MAKVAPYPMQALALRDKARKILRAAARARRPSGVMTNPPTLMPGTASAASTLTTGYGNSGALTSAGVTHMMTSAAFAPISMPAGSWVVNGSGHSAFYMSTGTSVQGHGVAFRFSGRVFELGVLSATSTARVRIVVTDPTTGVRQAVSPADIVPTPGSSFLKVDFGAKADRIVEVYFGPKGLVLAGFNFMKADDVRAWRWPDAVSMALCSDSYGAGANTASIRDNPDYVLGELLGAPSLINMSIGGTGCLNNAGSSATFNTRMNAGDFDASKIGDMDILKLDLSLNDNLQNNATYTDATFQAAAQAYIARGMQAQPNAIIFVKGPQYAQSASAQTPAARYAAGLAAMNAAIAAAGDTSGRVLWFDTSAAGEGWQTGTGKAPYGSVIFTANPSAGDTVTLGGTALTFATSIASVAAATAAGQVLIGPTLADTLANLATVANGSSDAAVSRACYVPGTTAMTVYGKGGTDAAGFTIAASVAKVTGTDTSGTASSTTLNTSAMNQTGTGDNETGTDGTHLIPTGNFALPCRMQTSIIRALTPLAA